MWFLIFLSGIFNKVMALADSNLVPATPATFFIKLTWNFAECFIMIWRWACDFKFLVLLILTKTWPFLIFGIISTFEPFDRESWILVSY